MKTYEFQCGGDHGAWECMVDIQLDEIDSDILEEYSQSHEFLDYEDPVKNIYSKVYRALEAQCDDDADLNNIMIWVPFGIKRIL